MTKTQQEDSSSEREDTVVSFDSAVSNGSKKNKRRKDSEVHVDDIVDALLGGEMESMTRKSSKRQGKKNKKKKQSSMAEAEEDNLDELVAEQILGEENNEYDDVADLYAWESPVEEPAEDKSARQERQKPDEEELDAEEMEERKAERQRMMQLALAAAESSSNAPDDMPRDENEWFSKLERESTAGRKQKPQRIDKELGDEDDDLPTDFIRDSGSLNDSTHRRGGTGVVVPKEKREAAGKYLAVDCEMVGCGFRGSRSMLARVSIINYYGHTILDTYVVPMEPVTDYRTWVSGIRKSDIDYYGRPFLEVQKQVADLIKGRILVGHAIQNDLKALMLRHPPLMLRDTSRFEGFRNEKGSIPALRHLAASVLNITIQQGEHSSVTDAKTTMLLYRKVRDEWERLIAPKLYKQKVVRAKTKERFARLRREIDEAEKSAAT